MKTLLTLSLILFCAQGFCQSKGSESKNFSSVNLSGNDSTFLALKGIAQAHLQFFIDSLNIHGNDTARYMFAIKSDFVQNGKHEHMWSNIFSYNKGMFNGVLIDSAFYIKNIKTGDKVIVGRQAIEDWLIGDKVAKKTFEYFSEMYLNGKKN